MSSLIFSLLFLLPILAFYYIKLRNSLKILKVDTSRLSGMELAEMFLQLSFITPDKAINKFNETLSLLNEAEKSVFFERTKNNKNLQKLNIKHLLFFKKNNNFLTQIVQKNLQSSHYDNIKIISDEFLAPFRKDSLSWVFYLKEHQLVLADFNHLNASLKSSDNKGSFFNNITHKHLKKELSNLIICKVGNYELINLSFIQILETMFDLEQVDQNLLTNMILKNKEKVKSFHISNFVYNLSNFKDFKFLSPKTQSLIIKEILFPFNIEDIPSYSLYSFLLSENVLKVLEEISFWQESLTSTDLQKIKNINFTHIKELHDVLLSYGLKRDLDSLTSKSLDQNEILYLDGQNLTYFFTDYTFFIPKNSSEINQIGQEMSICIGNLRYEYFIKAKKSFIAFLKNSEGKIEICIEIEDILGQHRIKEIKGYRNERINSILYNKINKLLKK